MKLEELLANNRAWAREATAADPEYFARLARQQAPQFLWIGCSDSRVPANQITGLAGELQPIQSDDARHRRLCELNVREQVHHISQCTSVQDAWARQQPLAVHGWIYDLQDGLLRDLDCTRTE